MVGGRGGGAKGGGAKGGGENKVGSALSYSGDSGADPGIASPCDGWRVLKTH